MLSRRYEFIYLFDVKNGNPNGDPDADNMPRIDPTSNTGLVSDVAIKRRIRNYVELSQEAREGFDIYIRENAVLNKLHAQAHKSVLDGKVEKTRGNLSGKLDQLTGYMCQKYYDVRTFGAVMSTGINCGQVRGPVQLSFAQSIDPIIPSNISITRMAVTTEEEAKGRDKNQTMGRKYIVPYGLYRVHGYISAKLAEHTGFSDEDLELLWESLDNMYEHDRSSSKGEMSARGLIAFEHEKPLGNAHARDLFDKVQINPLNDLPSSFSDYKPQITIDESMPDGITLKLLLDPRN